MIWLSSGGGFTNIDKSSIMSIAWESSSAADAAVETLTFSADPAINEKIKTAVKEIRRASVQIGDRSSTFVNEFFYHCFLIWIF
jgi:superfamily II RNA helicase